MQYTDFSLFATEPEVSRNDGKKRLTFKLHVPGVTANPLTCDLDMREFTRLTNAAGAPAATWSDALALGQAMALALLPAALWHALNLQVTQASTEERGVRVRLMLSGPELNGWPWEFLVFNRAGGELKPSDFLALLPNVSLVRHPATPLPAWRVEAKAPIRVLVAIASPEKGWPLLQVAEELRLVEEALRGSGRYTVDGVEHARRSQLPAKDRPAHIFHFAGHGIFEQTRSPVAGKGSLILEDEYGDADPLDADLLAVQLRDAGVRVAVLGACQTAQRDDLHDWSSVAEALLKAELGAVVGMQFSVLDASALCFSQKFYQSLALGLSIDEAVAAGRVAIAATGDARGWATPVLFLRAPDGVIFGEFAGDPALDVPRVSALSEIAVLRGRATTVRIGAMSAGRVDAETRIGVVKKGAHSTTVAAGHMAGGDINAKSTIGEVKGQATTVSIGEMDYGGATVKVNTRIGRVGSGASSTGVTVGAGSSTPSSRRKDSKPAARTPALQGAKAPIPPKRPDAKSMPDAIVPSVEEALRLDVALPKTAVVGEPFDQVIAVRQVSAPVLAVADLDETVSTQGRVFRREEQDVVRYRLEVAGIGLRVTPDGYTLQLRRGENSVPAAFQVVSARPGKRTFVVSAFQEDGALAARTRLRIEVVVAVTPV